MAGNDTSRESVGWSDQHEYAVRRRETLEDQLNDLFNGDAADDEEGQTEKPYTYESVSSPIFTSRSPSAVERARVYLSLGKTSRSGMISRDQAMGYIRDVESVLPDLPKGVLEFILSHEMGFSTEKLDPSIRGGSGGKYVGLYQFYHLERSDKGTYAWGAARQELARRGVALPPLSQGWNDPYYSTLAAGGLALANRRVIEGKVGRKAIREWTPVVFYAAHQQGAGYVIAAVKTGRPGPLAGKQSKASTAALQSEFRLAIT